MAATVIHFARCTLIVTSLITSAPSIADTVTVRFACNLKTLTANQRSAHDALTHRLLVSVLERREIASGFELRIDSKRVSIVDLASWVDAERRCCPFLGFAIEKEPNDGALWIGLTGPEGVKDFLLAEMEAEIPKNP